MEVFNDSGVSLCVEMFGVSFPNLTHDEKKEYWRAVNRKRSKAKPSLVFEMFGKKWKDLDITEKRLYYKVMNNKRR